MKSIALVALCFVTTLLPATSLRADPALIKLTMHDLRSADGLTYRVIVAAPPGPGPKAGYPVIYVMDGNAWAPMVSEVIRTNLDFGLRSKVEPAVVVGVGYPIDAPFDMVRRDWDLTTPTSVPADTGGSKVGGYESMARFIDQQVKPDIEKRFPIDRKRQTLAGHSLGGLFALRTLISHRDEFQTYVAMSPSIWWNAAAILKEAFALTPTSDQRGPRVYIGVGELEQHWTPTYRAELEAWLRASAAANPSVFGGKSVDAYMADMEGAKMVDNARELSNVLRDKGLEVHFDLFPDEDHFSVIPSAIGRAVPYALAR